MDDRARPLLRDLLLPLVPALGEAFLSLQDPVPITALPTCLGAQGACWLEQSRRRGQAWDMEPVSDIET